MAQYANIPEAIGRTPLILLGGSMARAISSRIHGKAEFLNGSCKGNSFSPLSHFKVINLCHRLTIPSLILLHTHFAGP